MTEVLITSLSAPESIIANIVFDRPEELLIIVTGTIGRTTSSNEETDRDVAVAASHAVALGEITSVGSAASAVDGAVGVAAAASCDLLKGASGTLFPCLFSPFFSSFSSFL